MKSGDRRYVSSQKSGNVKSAVRYCALVVSVSDLHLVALFMTPYLPPWSSLASTVRIGATWGLTNQRMTAIYPLFCWEILVAQIDNRPSTRSRALVAVDSSNTRITPVAFPERTGAGNDPALTHSPDVSRIKGAGLAHGALDKNGVATQY